MRDGATVFSFRPSPRFDNGTAAAHGGILSAVADFAVATAVTTTLPAGVGVVTSTLNATFVRPVSIGSVAVTCEGVALHVGRTVAYAEATITDAAGRLLVRATATCRLWRPESN